MEEAMKSRRYVRPGIGKPVDDAPNHSSQERDDELVRSTGERTKDRWFLEERGGRRVPKRLDIPNEVMVTSRGPLKMTGNITLVHEDGTKTHDVKMDFCRCGSSREKPFCDDKHIDIEFLDNGAIPQASDCMPTMVPQTVTVTCVRDGPLKFRGLLRIFNRRGQQCYTTSGALCRCGKSSKKPFCDCL